MKSKSRKPYYRDDAFLKAIGKRIREVRLKAGISQTELAFKCDDKDYSQINRVELGKVNFSVSYLILISQALKIKITDLNLNDINNKNK